LLTCQVEYQRRLFNKKRSRTMQERPYSILLNRLPLRALYNNSFFCIIKCDKHISIFALHLIVCIFTSEVDILLHTLRHCLSVSYVVSTAYHCYQFRTLLFTILLSPCLGRQRVWIEAILSASKILKGSQWQTQIKIHFANFEMIQTKTGCLK
jgi:hypothetical protein